MKEFWEPGAAFAATFGSLDYGEPPEPDYDVPVPPEPGVSYPDIPGEPDPQYGEEAT